MFIIEADLNGVGGDKTNLEWESQISREFSQHAARLDGYSENSIRDLDNTSHSTKE